jgi:Carboxypeptidase regulatory-like domain/TonB dependent receptor
MRRILVAVLSILLFTWSVLAQSETATLSGRLTDTSDAVIPNAQVAVTDVDTNVSASTQSNESGIYIFPSLPPGNYRLSIEAKGFRQFVETGIVLHTQDRVAENISMSIGSVDERVVVTADQNNINTTDATVSTTIDRNFVENLPLNGRSFQTLILLTPGTVLTAVSNNGGTFSVNGQRTNSNNFTVDGVSANSGGFIYGSTAGQLNGSTPSFTIAGSTQGMVSVDALQEFKIQTSTYAAEFGRQPGGQVSLLTRSGTNALHGTAFDYVRNEFFDANNWFNGYTNNPPIPKGKERQNDFGGTLGGPIFKNTTFFFFSYEGLRLLQPQTQVVQVPSLRLRQEAASAFQAILNSWPIPSGSESTVPDPVTGLPVPTGAAPYTFSLSYPTNLDAYSIKIDHTFGERIHLFGRYSDTRSFAESPNGYNDTETDRLVARALTLGTDMNVRQNLENELRLSYAVSTSPRSISLNLVGGAKVFDPSVLYPAPLVNGRDHMIFYVSLPNSNFDTTPGAAGKFSQRQINLIDDVSYSKGTHQLKLGIDYRRLFPIGGGPPLTASLEVDSENDLILGHLTIARTTASLVAHPIFTNFSVYGQDTWKASSRLSLTFGLRWEFNPSPGERDGLQPYNLIGINNPETATLAPVNSPLYGTTYNDFAPRIGAAYQLIRTPGHETVLRGGFGVFYDLNSELVVQAFRQAPFQNQSQALMNLSFPVANNVLPVPPVPTPQTPPFQALLAADPNLKLPYTLQWNLSFQRALGRDQSLTASYVASTGRRLLRTDNLFDFNPNFTQVSELRNASSSNYQSLQLQFNRRLLHGLQALASYTYSHSIDNASDGVSFSSAALTGNSFVNPDIDRGNSSFDLRHALSGAITYEVPRWNANRVSTAILGGWSLNTIAIAQTGQPVDLIGGNYVVSTLPSGFFFLRPNVVREQPLYLYGAQCAAADNGGTPCPGGMGFNPAAFVPVPANTNGSPTQTQGTLGRNVLRSFGAWQVDFALHRQFNLTERVNLQFRSEFFNAFNHPNFSGINTFTPGGNLVATSTLNNYLNAGVSGGLNSLYQIGGPRSIQFMLKVVF